MTASDVNRTSPWTVAAHAAALFAVDLLAAGGVSVRARPGPVRDAWLELLTQLLPKSTPLRRIPHHVSDGALLGGLDLAATLQRGHPVGERGLLAKADGGIVVLTSAERASSALAARIAEILDKRQATLQRDVVAEHYPARIGLVLLDEGAEDERPPQSLLDRLAFHVDLEAVRWSDAIRAGVSQRDIAEASARVRHVAAGDDVLVAFCRAASSLGISSIRAPLFALRAARAAAALAGRRKVSAQDAELAAALVLGPRATRLPAAPDAAEQAAPPPDGGDHADAEANSDRSGSDRALDDVVVAATQAAIPQDLLAQLQRAAGTMARPRAAGRAGRLQASLRRGRPAGVRRGEPRSGARLNIVETLRAAAPWQALRRRQAGRSPPPCSPLRRIDVRRDDFRVTRLEQRSETTSIFAVDASGSAALHRLAEAKGAVEQLLADCYVRRDRVALIAFRGTHAELILPPTRSLARAKRSLAGLPGGGGTPLATAIEAALALADAAQRKGQTPVVVLLTDGRANVARDGRPGREQAEADAMAAAQRMRAAALAALVVDISPRPHASAEKLAQEMAARYLPLPYADAKTLSLAVQAAAERTKGSGLH